MADFIRTHPYTVQAQLAPGTPHSLAGGDALPTPPAIFAPAKYPLRMIFRLFEPSTDRYPSE